MSHFSTLIITNEMPTDEVIGVALAPFHEFECTGDDNEYVQNVDKLPAARVAFEYATATLVVKRPDGSLSSAFNAEGEYKLEFLPFLRNRDLILPPGYEELRGLPAKDYETFAEWAHGEYGLKVIGGDAAPDLSEDHKYGWIRVRGGEVVEIVDRTNPSAKWDWWAVGGRYSGRLIPGYDPESASANREACFLCQGTGLRNDEIGNAQRVIEPSYTCNGCGGTGRSIKFPTKWRQHGNRARVGDLDLPWLKATRISERREMVENMMHAGGFADVATLDDARRVYASLNKLWVELPEPRPRGAAFNEWLIDQPNGTMASAYKNADPWGDINPSGDQTISEWIDAAPALSAFAVVKDGEWYERGDMGWFGCVSDEKPDWANQFDNLFTSLQPNQWITFVDCHI